MTEPEARCNICNSDPCICTLTRCVGLGVLIILAFAGFGIYKFFWG